VLWLDPLSHCNNLGLEKDQSVNVFAPGQMGIFLDRMSRVMISVSKYTLTKEVHGFGGDGFAEYSGIPKGTEFDLVTGVCTGTCVAFLSQEPLFLLTQVVRTGSMFGGTYAFLKLLTTLLDALAEATLNSHLLGNDASLTSILFARFPDLVRASLSYCFPVLRPFTCGTLPSVCRATHAPNQQRM
jgi:hypothetical protein